MSVEDGGPVEVWVEPADDDWDEVCPGCEKDTWLRAIAGYRTGACWVVFCGGCGKTIQKRWNILP
jgi:hypothetical protein